MFDEEPRLVRARLRTDLRRIDARIAAIEDESRRFRRYGFGSDVHDIQLGALRAERAECARALAEAGRPGRRRATGRTGLGSWLVLPAVVGAMLLAPFGHRPITRGRAARRGARSTRSV
jgi:hypothetical protein